MKRSVYLLAAILSISMVSCSGQSKGKEAGQQVAETQSLAGFPNNNESAKPVHLTKADFLKLVMDYEKNTDIWLFQGEKPCMIDFYADWCGPCRITSPILEDLAKQYAGQINFYKINVDKEQELAAVFGVQNIPTFLFCPLKGKPTISSGISNTPDATKAMFIKQIEELLLLHKGSSSTI